MFALISLFVIVFISFDSYNGQDIITPILVKQLLEEAWRDSAPFRKTALERLHGAVFGKDRAARSTDIVIFNLSDHTFKLRNSSCANGAWTNSLLPEYFIPAHTSVVFGSESYRLFRGSCNCYLRYKSRDRAAGFEISVSNPYIGRNKAWAKGENVEVQRVVGSGYNNIVRFTVNDHFLKKNLILR